MRYLATILTFDYQRTDCQNLPAQTLTICRYVDEDKSNAKVPSSIIHLPPFERKVWLVCISLQFTTYNVRKSKALKIVALMPVKGL